MHSLHGKWIAPQAAKWLAEAKSPRVHSIFHHSVNILDNKGSLLSVVLPGLGPGPFAIVAAPERASFPGFQELDIGSPIHLFPERMQIGDVEIWISEARKWNPNPDWAKLSGLLNPSLLSEFILLLEKYAPAGSFAPLVGGIVLDQGPTIQDRALQAALEPSRRLLSGLAGNDLIEIQDAVRRLAGLGGGVTPSGDDYLQGIIHALWTRLPESQARSLGIAIVNEAVARTNAVSGEWLKAAARGEAGEDWHLLAQALQTDDELKPTAARLIRRGHTSGADAMAGYISAMKVLRDGNK